MSRRWDKMPHETVWERHGAVVRFWGRLTGRELADAADDIASDPRLDGLRFVITDLLALESHAVDAASMERVAITRLGSRQTNPNVRLLVVTTDPVFLALVASAAKGVFVGTNEPHTFDTVADARAWYVEQPALDGLRGTGMTGSGPR